MPRTPLTGQQSAFVEAGQTTTLNFTLAGIVTTATVTPANGALNFAAESALTITASAPLNATTITTSNIQLERLGSSPGNIALKFVLSGSRQTVSVIPTATTTGQPALEPSTQYRLTITGLRDAYGQPVVVPSSVTFTTKAFQAPTFNPDAIVFGLPDAEGLVPRRFVKIRHYGVMAAANAATLANLRETLHALQPGSAPRINDSASASTIDAPLPDATAIESCPLCGHAPLRRVDLQRPPPDPRPAAKGHE